MLKSISKNLEKDTVLTVKKNSIIIDLEKNVKLFITCSSELSDLKDREMTTVSIEQFIKKKTSEFSSESSSDYSFNSASINNMKMIHKSYTCSFKTVSHTRTLNDLCDEIANNYYLADEYNMKKKEAVHIFIQQNLLHMWNGKSHLCITYIEDFSILKEL